MVNNTVRTSFGRLVPLSLAAVALSVFAVASARADASAAAAAPERTHVEVIELQLQDLQYEAIDLGAAGPSLGDTSVYSGTAVSNGRAVGRGGGSSQVVGLDGAKRTSQVVITLELDRGALTMQSLRTGEASSLDMAITGGTGDFRDARGTVHYWKIGTPDEKLRAEILH
ncbi:hypothetical protein GCM10010329_80040 [Streptomyces spiroverticillatus]|nr:hypothetical protein GCM10010329_80040 [Streptomyces spiroverticillatus]